MIRTERLFAHFVLFLILPVSLSGCGSDADPNKGINVKPTVQVTGKVLVDGVAPETPVAINAHVVGTADSGQPPSSGVTGKDGVFSLNTYNAADGMPVGEYKLTFLWGQMSMHRGMQGADQLGGQYSEPGKSQFTVKVTESKDVLDIGVFELKKAAKPKEIPKDGKR